MKAVRGALGTSEFAVAKNGPVVEAEKFSGSHGECRQARMVEEEQSRPQMVVIYLISDKLQGWIGQKFFACTPWCLTRGTDFKHIQILMLD